MPTYAFEDKNTGETFTDLMSMKDLDKYLSDNPHLVLLPSAPAIVSGIAGRNKPDQGFRDLLREQKKHFDKVDKRMGTKNSINTFD